MMGMRGKAALLGVMTLVAGCSTISEHRGYIVDETLLQSVQPGVDNRTSVEGALGRPTFASQFGPPTWYYVSSFTGQKPFNDPKIRRHTVLAVSFDEAGNVVSANRSGMEAVLRIKPDSDLTPTLGRNRTFFQDLFGNIGQVGAGMGGGAGGGAGQ